MCCGATWAIGVGLYVTVDCDRLSYQVIKVIKHNCIFVPLTNLSIGENESVLHDPFIRDTVDDRR